MACTQTSLTHLDQLGLVQEKLPTPQGGRSGIEGHYPRRSVWSHMVAWLSVRIFINTPTTQLRSLIFRMPLGPCIARHVTLDASWACPCSLLSPVPLTSSIFLVLRPQEPSHVQYRAIQLVVMQCSASPPKLNTHPHFSKILSFAFSLFPRRNIDETGRSPQVVNLGPRSQSYRPKVGVTDRKVRGTAGRTPKVRTKSPPKKNGRVGLRSFYSSTENHL